MVARCWCAEGWELKPTPAPNLASNHDANSVDDLEKGAPDSLQFLWRSFIVSEKLYSHLFLAHHLSIVEKPVFQKVE